MGQNLYIYHPQRDVPTSNLERPEIPQGESAKYLGQHFDRGLNWRKHIFTKRKLLGIQSSKMYWLFGQQIASVDRK